MHNIMCMRTPRYARVQYFHNEGLVSSLTNVINTALYIIYCIERIT